MQTITPAGSARNPSGDVWSTGGGLSQEAASQLDAWVSRHLVKPAELPLIPLAEVPRYVPGTATPLAGYQPAAHVQETITFQIGAQDVIVKHKITNGSLPNHGGGGKRGKITQLSKPSIKRMKLAIRNVPDGSVTSMLTLTYPKEFPCDGDKVKRDLRAMRKWLVRHHVGGVWILEFQKRGAPHLHLFLTGWPSGGIDGVARAWYRIVGSDDRKHLDWHLGKLSGRPCLEWMRKPHVASLYATKYAAKQEQKAVPEGFTNVGRFWGVFGNLRPVWRFVVGHGYTCGNATRQLVNHYKCRFDGRALQGHWLHKLFVSSVLWGGAAELDEILAFVKWTPF